MTTDDRRLRDRLTRLARVTAQLVHASDEQAVTRIVTESSSFAVGATIASLTLRDGPDRLRLVGLHGGLDGDEERFACYPISLRTPASDVIRSGERLVISGRSVLSDRYPDLPGIDRGERSLMALPLNVPSGTLGAIGLSFPGLRTFDTAELDFMDILADTCAQALVRIQAEGAAAEHQARLAFLAEASAELSSSLDYEATLAAVAQLAVPTFADWCAIDLVKDGRLHRLAVAHVDPAKVELARDLAERYPSEPSSPAGPWHVMRTGRSELVAQVTDEMLVAGARDEEHLRIARELKLNSAMTVPLVTRGRVLGVISWVAAESGRCYDEEDVSFAQELAERAAVAIDNSELHSETLQAAVRLQHAVLPDALPEVPGCDISAFYSPSGRTEVGGDFYDVIPLSDGRVVLFVGDVMGRGVAAAASMAQLRAAVRAYIALDPTPDVVLARLDRMLDLYGADQLVTLIYLVVDLAGDEVLVADAGHPPPVVLRGDGRAERMPVESQPPLGVSRAGRTCEAVALRPGETMLVFTDGLVERRGEDLDRGGTRLLDALGAIAGSDLDAGVATLVGLVRDPTRDDDVAAVALRRHG